MIYRLHREPRHWLKCIRLILFPIYSCFTHFASAPDVPLVKFRQFFFYNLLHSKLNSVGRCCFFLLKNWIHLTFHSILVWLSLVLICFILFCSTALKGAVCLILQKEWHLYQMRGPIQLMDREMTVSMMLKVKVIAQWQLRLTGRCGTIPYSPWH